MNLLQALSVAVVAALISGALTAFVAVINMRVSIAELRMIIDRAIEFRLQNLERDVKDLRDSLFHREPNENN